MSCANLKIIIRLLSIIIMLSCFRFCHSSNTFISNTSNNPEIWASSFLETGSFKDKLAEHQFRNSSEFKNEFIHKFNETDYIIQHGTKQVVFICHAKHPVMWYVPHLKQVENFPFTSFKTDTVREVELGQVPKNKYFRTSLTVNFDGSIRDVFSVNFTCGSPDTNDTQKRQFPDYLSSSIHIYYFEGLQAIENSRKVVEIKVPKSYAIDTITIPCRPSIPTASVLIEKKTKTQQNNTTMNRDFIKWKNLTEFTFNPKNGFTLHKNGTESLFGQYRCTLIEKKGEVDSIKKEQVVQFNVTAEDNKESKPAIENIKFQPIRNLKGNAVVKYGKNTFGKNIPSRNFSTPSAGNPELWCCTGMSKVQPKIYKRKCTSHLQCEILKRSMAFNVLQRNDETFEYHYAINEHSTEDQGDCLSTTLYRVNVVGFCKGENILFGDHLINLFDDKLMPVSTRQIGDEKRNLWTYESESSHAAADISRRIFLTVGHPVKKHEEYELSMKFTTFTSSDEDAANSTQYVAEYSRDYFYVGENLIPICLGWLSFYSRGGFVRVVFANGTSTVLNMTEAEKPSKYLLNFSAGLNGGREYLTGDLVEFTFSKHVLAQKDMTSFECWQKTDCL